MSEFKQEKLLQAALSEYQDGLLADIPSEEELRRTQTFSPQFVRNMEKLIRQQNHPPRKLVRGISRRKRLKAVVAEEQCHEMNADGFLQLVRQYTDIRELTPDILLSFVDRIVVHHRAKQFGEMVQKVEIYYKMIGFVELPEMNKSEKERLLASFGRNEQDRSA